VSAEMASQVAIPVRGAPASVCGNDPSDASDGLRCPLHADPHASLTQLPMESYSVFRQPEGQGGEPTDG
jgi:hypothetical protein